MKLRVKEIRHIIENALVELGPIRGGLRRVRSGGKQQYRVGKIEDENQELSTGQAEMMFPGSTDAWAEVVPHLFPDFPFDDPVAIKKSTAWFKIKGELRTAFQAAPQIELAAWNPQKEDWVELNYSTQHAVHENVEWRAPEYASIEEFAEYMMDDERDEYTHEDLIALNRRLRKPVNLIRKELDSYGFKLATREPEKQTRGFNTSSHDRWFGPGSLKTHGGTGIDPHTGRATTKGTV